MSCAHVRADHVVPGWGCCQCRAYNGYQREICRACGHLQCYDEGGEKGREARELGTIGHDHDLVREWLAKNSGGKIPHPGKVKLVRTTKTGVKRK